MKFLILFVVLVSSLSVQASEKVSATGIVATCYQGKARALHYLLESLSVSVRAKCESKGGINSFYDDINEELTVNLNPQSSSDCGGVSATLESNCLF